MTTIEIGAAGGMTIDGAHYASHIVSTEHTPDGVTRVSIDGPSPQVLDEAERLRERFGWDVKVAPTTGVGSIEDVAMHTTAGGDRWVACPVCKVMADGYEVERGEVIRYLEDPEERRLAAMGVTGGFRSEKELVLSWQFVFSPCGDVFIAYASR